jgi:hypothetical protein
MFGEAAEAALPKENKLAPDSNFPLLNAEGDKYNFRC